MKNKLIKERKNKFKKVLFIASMVSMLAILFCQPVFATGDGAAIVTDGLSALTDIIKAFVSSIGTMVVLWGLFEWGNSMQSHDGMMQSAAFKRIGGGLIMTLGPQLLEIFV